MGLDFGSRKRVRRSQPVDKQAEGASLGRWMIAYWDSSTQELLSTEQERNYSYSTTVHYPNIEMTWDQKHPGPPFRAGGPFANLKVTDPSFQPQSVGHQTTCPEHRDHYGTYERGFDFNGFVDCPTFLGLLGPPVNADGSLPSNWVNSRFVTDLSSLGPEAYAKTMPRLSEAGVSQFLAESRDIPRMLKQTGRFFHDLWKVDKGWRDLRNKIDPHAKYDPFKNPKRISEDYLNYQFGWVPFVSDINKMINTYHESEKFMFKRISQNDKWQKRTANLGTEEDRVLYQRQANAASYQPYGEAWNKMMRASLDGPGYSGARSVTSVFKNTLKHTWASGLFRYYRPEFDTSLADYASGLNALKRNLTLYGAGINPSVLYKITPWSWLVDWFSNVGNNIDNFNAQLNDGVASKYFYVMCHTQELHEQETVFNFWSGPKTVSWFRNIETKQRVEGSPYGLGWSSNSLTTRQLAILTSLGISRWK